MDRAMVAIEVASDAASHLVGADCETNVAAKRTRSSEAIGFKALLPGLVRRKWEGSVSSPSRTAWFRGAAAST